MIRLNPHVHIEKRMEKAIKHFFNTRERWWDLVPEAFLTWQGDWTALRAARAFEPEGWTLLPGNPDAVRIATAGYDRWLLVAERSCNLARERQQVYPGTERDRLCYVSPEGVTVIAVPAPRPATPAASPEMEHQNVVTAFRPELRWTGDQTTHAAASADVALRRAQTKAGLLERAAVRRRHRHASLRIKRV